MVGAKRHRPARVDFVRARTIDRYSGKFIRWINLPPRRDGRSWRVGDRIIRLGDHWFEAGDVAHVASTVSNEMIEIIQEMPPFRGRNQHTRAVFAAQQECPVGGGFIVPVEDKVMARSTVVCISRNQKQLKMRFSIRNEGHRVMARREE